MMPLEDEEMLLGCLAYCVGTIFPVLYDALFGM